MNCFSIRREAAVSIPPCPIDITDESSSTATGGGPPTQTERLLTVCREFTAAYQEVHERYHESIYNTADKVLRTSQTNQMKLLKTQLEKETNDVMRQLNLARRNEVKALALVHKDRDELVR